MKQKNLLKKILPLFLAFISFYSFGQVISDDFDDGDITDWTQGTSSHWASSTSSPINGTNSIKHNLSNTSGSSYIVKSISSLDLINQNTTWQFNLKNGNWDPSSGNKFWVYLTANESDLNSGTVDGYAIGVNLTGTSDLLTLWKVTDGAADGAIITTDINWDSSDTYGIKITRSSAGNWEVLTDANGDFDNLVSKGTATNTDYTFDDNFGLSFTYSSSRAGLLWMDDVTVEGTAPSTNTNVSFIGSSSSISEDGTSIDVCVSISNEDGSNPTTVQVSLNGGTSTNGDDYSTISFPLTLTFPAGSSLNQCVTFTLTNDSDLEGDETIILELINPSGGNSAELGALTNHTLTITDDDKPSLIISEVADPVDFSGRFVEIYNNGDAALDLASLQIYFVKSVNAGSSYSKTALTGTIQPNEIYVIANSTNLTADYGFSPDIAFNSADGNGDDAYALYYGGDNNTGTLLDSYGVQGVDGTGQSWEYENSRAFRLNPKTVSPNAVWTNIEWTIESGDLGDMTPGALENEFRYDGVWKPRDVSNATSSDNILISSSVSLNSNLEANNLEVTNSAIVTINSGIALKINGTSSGNVTYTRTLGSTNWYLMSSPVTGEGYDTTWIADNNIDDTSSSKGNIGIATYNPGNTGSAAWTYVTGGSGTFDDGKGYSIKQDVADDISFTGTVNTGDVETNSLSTGFNLLGNPYLSYVNSATFLASSTSSNIDQTQIWLWNQALGMYEVKTFGMAWVLSPGQGFFVNATSSGTVTFDKSNQATSGNTFQKSLKTEIKLLLSDGENNRFAKLNFGDNFSKGFDYGWEGETFGGIPNSLSVFTSLVNDNLGKKYQVQSLPNSDYEDLIVPIGITADANKEITFTAKALNLPADIKVYLEDRLNNTFTRLDETNSSYAITLTEKSDGIGRFFLHTKSSALSTSSNYLESVSIYKSNASTLKIAGLTEGKASFKLFNVLGKQVLKTSFTSNNGVQDINLPKLATGIYVIQLETEAGQLNKKITIE
jgi:trimeric autotransporter adhesin